MQYAQLLEQLDGEVHHVLDMLLVAPVIFDKGVQRIGQHVGERTLHRHGHRLIEHNAFAQSRSAHGERLDIQILGKRTNDRKRGRHDVGARGRKSADTHTLFHVELAHRFVNAVEILRGKLVVVHGIHRIFSDDAVDFIEVTEGTAHADHLRVRIDLLQPLYFLELLGKKFLDALRLQTGRAVVLKQIG